MIKVFAVLTLILLFFVLGFILGYLYLRTKCNYGGIIMTDQKENITYAKIEDESVITEGNYVTFRIQKDKS